MYVVDVCDSLWNSLMASDMSLALHRWPMAMWMLSNHALLIWCELLSVLSYEVCYEFSPGFTAQGRRTGVEPVNMVIIHIMQHYLLHILRCVAVCNM